MTNTKYATCVFKLEKELQPALGCTEPIAIAFAASKAKEVLGKEPDKIIVRCSGNIIKNAKAVIIPNTDGLRGVEAAAILGVIAGNTSKGLEVLADITERDKQEARSLIGTGFCNSSLAENVPVLFINVKAYCKDDTSSIVIEHGHTNITRIYKNDVLVFSKSLEPEKTINKEVSEDLLSISDIIDFADCLQVIDVQEILERQIQYNEAISQEGLAHEYGLSIGKAILSRYDGTDVRIRARAKAAAGSDARMGGCSFPVVINSGSGNQGITVSVPVIEYAKTMHITEDQLLRSLALSNLIAIHLKRNLGNLSAFCGVVFAAAGAASGIAYLHGGKQMAISKTIINTLASVGGMFCDGAKASCAAKVSSALEAAIVGYEIGAIDDKTSSDGEGLVKQDIEATIKNYVDVGREGMRETDQMILRLLSE